MLDIFYRNGTFKKKRYVNYIVGRFAGIEYRHEVWMGDFEPEPTQFKSEKGQIWFDEAFKQNTFIHKLPDKFKPKPAYKGAR